MDFYKKVWGILWKNIILSKDFLLYKYKKNSKLLQIIT
jgi:hypothetical protein